MNEDYKEYLNEIPLNTIKEWNRSLMETTEWKLSGWSGDPKEPFRHWTCFFPELTGVVKQIWDCINFSFKEDGFVNLKPDRIIANLYGHGDSSWLHRDSELPTSTTAIIYLNDYWDLNWGGSTIIVKDNEIERAFAPTPGKFILFKGSLLHGPTPVSREAPYPRLGLTFQM